MAAMWVVGGPFRFRASTDETTGVTRGSCMIFKSEKTILDTHSSNLFERDNDKNVLARQIQHTDDKVFIIWERKNDMETQAPLLFATHRTIFPASNGGLFYFLEVLVLHGFLLSNSGVLT